jgi:hypothetical protein
VFDLLVDILEFELKLPFLFVSDAHHLLEVQFDLDHLVVKAFHLFILNLCGFVHFCFPTD